MRAPDAAQRSCGALLIRGAHYFLRVALGPGSAVHREERCTASRTRSFTPSQDDAVYPYLSRVTVEAGSMPGSSMSAEDLGIASITSMPLLWQMLASPAGNAASVTKVWIWLICAMRTGALRRSFVESATSITLRALAIMAWAACTSR